MMDSSSSTIVTEFKTKQIAEWVGERFVFLDMLPESRHHGYAVLRRTDDRGGRKPLPYDQYVGKIVTITNLERGSWFAKGRLTVHMRVEETGERLSACPANECVNELGCLSDIERARAIFVGRSLWRTKGWMDTYDRGVTSINPFQELQVMNVIFGWYQHAPVRFIVQTTDGVEGFVDVNMSGTNVPKTLVGESDRFENQFQLIRPATETTAERLRSHEPSAESRISAEAQGDVLGWQQSWWGMTEDELMKAFGPTLKRLSARQMYDNAYAQYIIPNYKLQDESYTVVFQMGTLSNRLVQVLIKADNLPKDSPILKTVDAIVTLLSQRYGPSESANDQSHVNHIVRHRQWIFPGTTIELSYSFVNLLRTPFHHFTIRYFATPASDADKL